MFHYGAWQITRMAFAAILVLTGPFIDLRMLRTMKEDPTPKKRLRFYRKVSASLTGFALVSWLLMGFHGVLRLSPLVIAHAGILGKPVARLTMDALSVGFCGLAFYPGVICLLRKRLRATYTKALAKSDLRYLFPVSRPERRWWLVLNLAAGVCEEVIVRGFLLQVARGELQLGLLTALLVTSAAFGLAHLYQGMGGMVKTGLTGLVLGCVAIVSGGLLLPMLLHTMLDAQIWVIYRPSAEALTLSTSAR